jgi:hypothetical protein
MAKRQQENHEELDATFPRDVVQKWETMISDWNADHSAPDPYVEPVVGESFFSRIYPPT